MPELVVVNESEVHIQSVVRTACEELRQLTEQKAVIGRRISALKQTIAGLAELSGSDIIDDDLKPVITNGKRGRQDGFTNTCRRILSEAQSPMTANQFGDVIAQRCPELSAKHKNLLASITTVLNRLVSYGEAESSVGVGGRRVWRPMSKGSEEKDQSTLPKEGE